MENQLRSADETNAEIEAKAELREENIRRMNEGMKPIYLNRSGFLDLIFMDFF